MRNRGILLLVRHRGVLAFVAAFAFVAGVGVVALFIQGDESPQRNVASAYAGAAVPEDPALATTAVPEDVGGALPTGGSPLPDFEGADVGDDGTGPLPLGTINEIPDNHRLDFLFEFCWPDCFRDAHFMDPNDPQRGSGVWQAGAPFHVRHGFVNESDEPLGEGYDVELYVTPLDQPGEFGGQSTATTVRYTSDYVLRGTTDQCGPTYESQTEPATCEWFVHDFPDGLPAGRFAMWAVWEAPCSAWTDMGLGPSCTDPDEIVSHFSSGFDAPFDSEDVVSFDEINMAAMTPEERDAFLTDPFQEAIPPREQSMPPASGGGDGQTLNVTVSGVTGHTGDDLAGVLYEGGGLTDLERDAVGGFWSVISSDADTMTELVREPGDLGVGQFPFVTDEALKVEPGTYTLVVWVDTRLNPASRRVPVNTDGMGLFGCQAVLEVGDDTQTDVVVPADLHPDGWTIDCAAGLAIPGTESIDPVEPLTPPGGPPAQQPELEVDASGAAATGGTPLPDFDGAVAVDEDGKRLPLGTVSAPAVEDRLDFLAEQCWDEHVCFRDAMFVNPDDSSLRSAAWQGGRPFHVRHGFINENEEPLGDAFDVVLYVTPLDQPGGPSVGETVRYTSDYVLRGTADRCGPTYRSATGPVACEWFVHEFPDGLPVGRHALWAFWEAPCSAWVEYGFADSCADPTEVMALFASGVDSPWESSETIWDEY